jgi:acetyl esterase
VLACLRWVAARASELAGPGGITVAGDSAGGHLAGLTTALAPAAGVPLRAQALIYPVIEPTLTRPSASANAVGHYLETETMRWYWRHYLPPGGDTAEKIADAGAVPVNLLELPATGTPPTLVLTAGFDPLRDEGLTYAEHLERGNVPVERLHFGGQIHGFVRFTAIVGAALDAIGAVGDFLRRHAREIGDGATQDTSGG